MAEERQGKIRIGIDVLGGDYAPEEVLRAVEQVVNEQDDHIQLYLVGPRVLIRDCLCEDVCGRVEIVEATEQIHMDEAPGKAFLQKENSTIVRGIRLLADGSIDAFVSAGSTGALMVAAMHHIGLIEGVKRPALYTLLPREGIAPAVLLDVGANADCRPDFLVGFARLGYVFSQTILGTKEPRTGLLNIGEEKGKGNITYQKAHLLLKEHAKELNFVGNVEGRNLFDDIVDVVVCDGFTGNVVLKALEALALQILKDIARAGCELPAALKKKYSWDSYGGSILLGLRKTVVVGHGISRVPAIVNMVKLAARAVERQLPAVIAQHMKKFVNSGLGI